MKQFGPATQTYFAAREGIHAEALLWITARDRVTGVQASIGLWTGAQDTQITIGGVARSYVGAHEVLDVQDIQSELGLSVRQARLSLSGISPGVETAIRAFEARLAPIEIHRALFSVTTGALVEEPHRVFKGWIDQVDFETGPIGGTTTCEVTIVSNARVLTRTLATKKSDESQRFRQGDRFRRHANATGQVGVWWGENRS